jgi:hypothetical protein
MLNQLMSHTTNKQKTKQAKDKNKRASTEHAKSAYVTQNKQTKTKQKSLDRTC